MSLRQRLFVLTAVALAPAIIILLYNEFSLRRSREAEVHRQALSKGELASLEIQRIFTGAENTLRALARAPVIRSFGPECTQLLADVQSDMVNFTSIAAIDATGLVRCRAEMPGTPLRVNDRPYFAEVMATGNFVVGEYTISKMSGKPVLPLAAPIKDEENRVVGVLAAGLRLDWLGERLRERSFAPNDALTIADRKGVIIAREPYPERFVGTRIPDEFMRLVHADEPGTLEVTSQDGTRRVIGYFPATEARRGIYVSAGVSKAEAMQPVDEAMRRNILITLLGAAAALLVAMRIGGGLVRAPISRLLGTVQAWRQGDAAARTGMRPEDGEIAEVGAAIDAFMEELSAGRAARRAAEEHRDLLARELDHRIKNILTTVQAIATQTFKKDVSLAAGMQTFTARLQAMASAHEMLVAQNWARADLAATILNTLKPFPVERFEVSGPPLQVGAKASLTLAMAVHELCTNAAKYGALRHPDGTIAIRWSVARGLFVFEWIEQDGPPVKPPKGGGFGSRMIERILATELDGRVELSYAMTGVTCRLEAPAENVLGEAGANVEAGPGVEADRAA